MALKLIPRPKSDPTKQTVFTREFVIVRNHSAKMPPPLDDAVFSRTCRFIHIVFLRTGAAYSMQEIVFRNQTNA